MLFLVLIAFYKAAYSISMH